MIGEGPELNGWRRGFDHRLVYLLAVLLPLLVGGGVFAYLIWTKPGPSGKPQADPGRLVRVFRAEKTSHRVAVSAYGTTRASEQWTAIAEVRGRTVKVNPRFEPGEILPAGLPLVSIDPTDYQLAVDRFEAETRAQRLALKELKQTGENLRQILELQKRQLALARAEYQRQRKAFERKAVSQSVLESAAGAYEIALTSATQTQNRLALIPVQRERTQAALDAATVYLEQAQRDLSKCEIELPFAARCADKSVEVNQYVAVGGPLGTFLALEKAEVVAMVETRKMPMLFPEGIQSMQKLDLTQVDPGESLWKRIRIPVEVTWGLGELRPVWHGRVARIASSLDSGTQTVPVIVEVPDPYKDVRPGIRPPLIPDAFCKVTAYGATLRDVLVIPRDALRDDRVYVLREARRESGSAGVAHPERRDRGTENRGSQVREGTLHIAPVDVLALEETLAVVKEGGVLVEEGKALIRQGEVLIQQGGASRAKGEALAEEGRARIKKGEEGIQEGDLVVLADLFPATEGMPLRGKVDTNPAKPRNRIDVPETIFDFDDRTAPAAAEPAGNPPTEIPPAAEPTPEVTP